VYGIQARGFSDERSLPETLEDVVSESLERIRSVQSKGPYRLLGWSFGGILAHRAATRLQSEGEQVERLFLFDSYPQARQFQDQAVEPQSIDKIWREIAVGTNLVIPPEAFNTALDAETIASIARKQSHILGTFSLDQLKQLAAVMANNARLVPTAKLGVFDGDMVLFVAKRQTFNLDRTHISPEAWRPFCHGSIRKIEIDAEHHQMLSPDALRQLGGNLR
jgi:thioesterase domain-containing protein